MKTKVLARRNLSFIGANAGREKEAKKLTEKILVPEYHTSSKWVLELNR